MKLILKSIGKIDHAEVEINGITVIAGENNTGKSTVGRALFSVFNSFNDIEKKIKQERTKSVTRFLQYMINISSNCDPITQHEMINVVAEELDNNRDYYKNSIQAISDKLKELTIACEYNEPLDALTQRIHDVLNVSDESVLETLLDKNLKAEFNGQVSNIFSNKSASITLQIKDQSINVDIVDNKVQKIQNNTNISLNTEIIYMDDPFVLDEYGRYTMIQRRGVTTSNHHEYLKNKLFLINDNQSVIDEIIANEKLSNIYNKISSVCSGELISSKRDLMYKTNNSDKMLDVKNLSTGLKTFVILKMLLTNGIIEHNGTIILDEPEIHLHPEWQILFAELIVLIQKEFGVHILLNTHSPYFLRAIQVYADEYKIGQSCKYYLSEVDQNGASLTDVSECIDKIYVKLSSPLQQLEDERWKDD